MDTVPPPGWYEEGAGFFRWWDGRGWTQHRFYRPPAAKAGWYRDRDGALRWWDGHRWTQHEPAAPTDSPLRPGWYHDDQGDLRWWDGQVWTEHLSTAQRAATVGPPKDTPSKRDRTKSALRAGLVIAGLVAVVAALSDDTAEIEQADDSEDDPWSTRMRGSCESCDGYEVTHLIYDDTEWEDQWSAPTWVEFPIGWDSLNRRCEECGHTWTDYSD